MALSITGNNLLELQALVLEIGSGTYVFDGSGGGKLGDIISAKQKSRRQPSSSGGQHNEAGAPIYNFVHGDKAGCAPTGCFFADTPQAFTGVSY